RSGCRWGAEPLSLSLLLLPFSCSACGTSSPRVKPSLGFFTVPNLSSLTSSSFNSNSSGDGTVRQKSAQELHRVSLHDTHAPTTSLPSPSASSHCRIRIRLEMTWSTRILMTSHRSAPAYLDIGQLPAARNRQTRRQAEKQVPARR
ncbi:hypothetical protein CI238_10950, partial [Colletotrichum incanum]